MLDGDLRIEFGDVSMVKRVYQISQKSMEDILYLTMLKDKRAFLATNLIPNVWIDRHYGGIPEFIVGCERLDREPEATIKQNFRQELVVKEFIDRRLKSVGPSLQYNDNWTYFAEN